MKPTARPNVGPERRSGRQPRTPAPAPGGGEHHPETEPQQRQQAWLRHPVDRDARQLIPGLGEVTEYRVDRRARGRRATQQDAETGMHTVNSHINRLRAKIESDPARPEYIVTVWGVGYRLG